MSVIYSECGVLKRAFAGTRAWWSRAFRLRKRAGLFQLAVALLGFAPAATALNPSTPVDEYLHSTWRNQDGRPIGDIRAIAQTPDGYLWLASSTGLLRFDGVTFVSWKPMKDEKLAGEGGVTSLATSPNGDLWIGTSSGVSRLRSGHLTNFTGRSNPLIGPPIGAVISLLAKRTGEILVAIRDGSQSALARIDPVSDRLELLASKLPFIYSMFEDRDRNLWLGTEGGLCRFAPGSSCNTDSFKRSIRSIGEDAQGRLLLAESGKGVLVFNEGPARTFPAAGLESPNAARIFTDQDGNVWIGTLGSGLLRWSQTHVQRALRPETLSGPVVGCFFEDREGNLWIGTNGGLDRLRGSGLSRLPQPNGASTTMTNVVTSTRNGEIFVGTRGGVASVREGRSARMLAGIPGPAVSSLYEDFAETLWVGTSGGLVYSQRKGPFKELRAPDGGPLRAFAITGDKDSSWFLDLRLGLLRVRDLVAEPPPADFPTRHDAYQIHQARDGTLWVGFFNGGVTAVSLKETKSFDVKDGLAAGPVYAIADDTYGNIWIGTAQGFSRYQDGKWTTWTSENGLPGGPVYDIVADPESGLWLMTSAGLLNLSYAQLQGARTASPLSFILLGSSYGISTSWTGRSFNPRLFRNRNGTILVATDNWVVAVDPKQIVRPAPPPSVVIEQAIIDGKSADLREMDEIEFRPELVTFNFTAPSLTVPESLQFRYKLEGRDSAWSMDGSDRSATFGALRPGEYKLLVTARSNGEWNPVPASLKIIVPKLFYETWVFRLSCGVALVMLVASVYVWRIRQVQRKLQLSYQERLRVTRELHDTLMQGFTGVVYQLDVALRLFDTSPAETRHRLETAVEQADTALAEGRQAISSLRTLALETSTLPEAMLSAVRKIVNGSSISADVHTDSDAEQLPYAVQADLYAIAREAVTNAVNHSGAKRVSVRLQCHGGDYKLTVEDNGTGFDAVAQLTQNKEGHVGLSAMKERAERIRARLDVISSPNDGARIEVSGKAK